MKYVILYLFGRCQTQGALPRAGGWWEGSVWEGSLVAEVSRLCVIRKHSASRARADSPTETLAAPDNIFVDLW